MLESQGLRPFDPYRTLQLHPHAPRQLIVAVYWKLVERWKTRASSPGGAEQAVNELNAAYELLLDPGARRAYDEDHGLARLSPPQVRISRKRLGVLGLGSPRTAVAASSDYYHLLRVDREADAEIIDLAHSVLSSQLTSRSGEDQLLRHLLDEACRTLRNSQLRALYDASLQAGAAAAVAPSAPTTPSPAEQGAPLEPGSISIDTGPVLEAAPSADPPAAERQAAATPHPDVAAPVPHMFRRNDAIGAPEPARAEHTAAASAEAESAVADAPVEAERMARLGQSPGVVATPALVGAAARVATATPRSGGLLHRMRLGANRASAPRIAQKPAPVGQQGLPVGRNIEAARDERLLTLRAAGDAPALTEPAAAHLPESGAEGALAELVFVAGPFTGSRVPVGKQALTLGSSAAADVVLPGPGGRVAPEHARIWRHGDHFVFRQLDGARTEISGHPLLLPLVMLEDGDDIQMGPHRFRFTTTRSARPAPG